MLTMMTVMLPQSAHAGSRQECEGNNSITIFPKWYKYLNPHWETPSGARVPECVLRGGGFPDAIPGIALAIFEILLRVAGLVAIIFIVYGGFQYLTSTGEPDKAKNARTTITNAVIGMLITMFATVIVNVVGRNIG
jgi:amino acid transporter